MLLLFYIETSEASR